MCARNDWSKRWCCARRQRGDRPHGELV
jgi:hypothetical protein